MVSHSLAFSPFDPHSWSKREPPRPSNRKGVLVIKQVYVKAAVTFGGLLALAAVGGAGLKW
jgi:hypothetical protein